MIKQRGYIFLVVIVCLFLTPLIQAQPPFEEISPPGGLAIESPIIEFIEQGESFEFHTHIYNASNGRPLYASDGNEECFIHIYGKEEGDHIFESEMGICPNGIDFELKVEGGNFTETGQYAVLIWCNNSFQGDFIEYPIFVTPTGEGLNSSESTIYFLVTLFAFSIFLGLLILNIRLPYGNPKNEKKEFIGIEYKKYVKVALIPLTYVSFLWFFNFLVGLSTNYLTLNMYGNLMGSMLLLLTKLAFPLLIVILLIELVLMVKDVNIQKEMKSLWAGS